MGVKKIATGYPCRPDVELKEHLRNGGVEFYNEDEPAHPGRRLDWRYWRTFNARRRSL